MNLTPENSWHIIELSVFNHIQNDTSNGKVFKFNFILFNGKITFFFIIIKQRTAYKLSTNKKMMRNFVNLFVVAIVLQSSETANEYQLNW